MIYMNQNPHFLLNTRTGTYNLLVKGEEIPPVSSNVFKLEQSIALLFSTRKLVADTIVIVPSQTLGISYEVIIRKLHGANFKITIGSIEKINSNLSATEYYNKFMNSAIIKSFVKRITPRDGVEIPTDIYFDFKATTTQDIFHECDRIINHLMIELNSTEEQIDQV